MMKKITTEQKAFQEKFRGEFIDGWLVVEGSLDCSHNQLTSLPDNLKVEGTLDCYNNQLKEVPEIIKKIDFCYIFEGLNWNDPLWINKILRDELTPQEILAIDNAEHRRVAWEYMDKEKLKELEGLEVLDEEVDQKGKNMRVVQFNHPDAGKIRYYNCFCPTTGREYYLGTNEKTCSKAKSKSFGFNNINFINEW